MIMPADQYVQDLEKKSRELDDCIYEALELAKMYAMTGEAHHKQWVIDKMVRTLTGSQYNQWVLDFEQNDDEWDEGIVP